MLKKTPASRAGKMLVTFGFPGWMGVGQVNLAGDFNDWSKTQHPMTKSLSDGNWTITLELDANRSYEFCYLLDGHVWANDDHADDYVTNGREDVTSVVETYEVRVVFPATILS